VWTICSVHLDLYIQTSPRMRY